ncbi:Galactose/methyl galactoside import ATP-binding protein MglA [Moorella thermoacetica]|uniref:Galactose/methyl galactoside import ATP-binding protein MglA n=1 Tax=Neomoorella thermoacetica TaxID=1525 RepID=A0AAC9MUD9_NEOTH|nr:sugar ABC transporter ATP-binding protein [Moorella thermoacetica]AOQ23640.1 Galactose/methyl galactoside import ATP-binding protein MglA [Moorella thermoacetica]TYL13824.1 Galactose/methyl galactoside import ATP-binding protein MglA [Moorella thermoacetica]
MPPGTELVLKMEGICKSFPGVKALDNVSFELRKGEIHALCGENGAGKSTLLKILAGIYQPDAGVYYIHDRQVCLKTIHEAKQNGIGLIPQEIELAPNMTVEENILMGQYPNRFGFIHQQEVHEKTLNLMAKLGEVTQGISLRTLVGDLSMGQKQLIEILRVLAFKVDILALDEPTSSLSEEEANQLFQLIADLRSQGISIIYVSHRLNEVFKVCDRVTVLKDGRYIGTRDIKETTREELIAMMVGRNLTAIQKDNAARDIETPVLLEVQGLTREPAFRDISFHVRAGEILGVFGIVGSGRTEVARAIFGLDRLERGTIKIKGKTVAIRSPREAVRLGLGMVPDDRRGLGLVLGATVCNNISLTILKRIARMGWVDRRQEKKEAVNFIGSLNIKTPSAMTVVDTLSGGNQQKVVVAKWLAARSQILIFDEPTRGIDVGAKREIYALMQKLAVEGKGIIMISSELPEILAISDRVLVFRDGSITKELENRPGLTEQEVLSYAIAK